MLSAVAASKSPVYKVDLVGRSGCGGSSRCQLLFVEEGAEDCHVRLLISL